VFPPALKGKALGGSYICAKWELRVTERCLAEDLGVGADSSFADISGAEIIRAFIKKRCTRAENTRQVTPLTCGPVWVLASGNDHRAGTWFDEDQRVVWLLAYGRHRSGQNDDFFPYCKGIDGDMRRAHRGRMRST
jgi:hypothetical protein